MYSVQAGRFMQDVSLGINMQVVEVCRYAYVGSYAGIASMRCL